MSLGVAFAHGPRPCGRTSLLEREACGRECGRARGDALLAVDYQRTETKPYDYRHLVYLRVDSLGL